MRCSLCRYMWGIIEMYIGCVGICEGINEM